MNECTIIAGFAGIGKTTVATKYKNVYDLESTRYEWDCAEYKDIAVERLKGKERIKNPLWPQNYIDEIKDKMQEYDILFVKAHPDILEVYDKENIQYVICYPCKQALGEYKRRYVERGNSAEYMERTINSYDWKVKRWSENPSNKIILGENEVLEVYLIKNGYNLVKDDME